ncbi:hypothetical protein ABVK25_008446 [Lepraria finkii]|uniref:Peptidase A1 domain-containing protein n=1 Tax=Lepraria finkii TaxID=1340010 RepID=A0ABR4B2V8_9LECA
MGGRDTSRYTGDVVTVPVVKQGYWSINVDSVEVGGADLGYLTGGGAIVDTGTGFIQAPLEVAAVVHSAIPSARALPLSSSSTTTRYVYPCNTPADKIPTFVIVGRTLGFHPDDFNRGSISKVGEAKNQPHQCVNPLSLVIAACMAGI